MELTKKSIVEGAMENRIHPGRGGFLPVAELGLYDMDGKKIASWMESLGFSVIGYKDTGRNGEVKTLEGVTVSTNGYYHAEKKPSLESIEAVKHKKALLSYYSHKGKGWEDTTDDRRLYLNILSMLYAALDEMENVESSLIWVAFNQRFMDDVARLDSILINFGRG